MSYARCEKVARTNLFWRKKTKLHFLHFADRRWWIGKLVAEHGFFDFFNDPRCSRLNTKLDSSAQRWKQVLVDREEPRKNAKNFKLEQKRVQTAAKMFLVLWTNCIEGKAATLMVKRSMTKMCCGWTLRLRFRFRLLIGD